MSNVTANMLTRTVAFMSLAFAAVSIVYSSICLVHFSVWSISSRETGEHSDVNTNVVENHINKWAAVSHHFVGV
jgi:preprotein translocase subunit SecG